MADHKHTLNRSTQTAYHRQWQALIAALIIFDALMIWGSLRLAYDLRFTSSLLTYYGELSPATYAIMEMIGLPIWLGLFALAGLYQRKNLLGGTLEYKQVIKAGSAGVVAIVSLAFVWRDVALVSRGWLVFAWIFLCASVSVERFVIRRVAYRLRRRGWLTARVLMVGANDQGIAIAKQWQQSHTSGMHVVGFVDDFKPIGTSVLDDLKVIGQPTALLQIIDQSGVDEVVVVPNAVAWETFEEIITQAGAVKDYELWLSPGFYEMLTNSVVVTNKSYVPLFTINAARLVGPDAIMKAVLDYGLGFGLLLVMLPIMSLIAAGLKLSRRSVFMAHRTIGQGDTIFLMWKFNSADDKPTRLQRGLHRYALDKLPQLFNVLTGHMSLVGPRPRVVDDQSLDPRQVHNLRSVKPGLIGPWLVTEVWSSLDETRDDLYYVRNWTIWLDLQILFQSIVAWFRLRRPMLMAESDTSRSEEAVLTDDTFEARRSISGLMRLPIKHGAPLLMDKDRSSQRLE
ncbi:MAG TPA: sugar transferase [Anaerolineae bacterium]|nr:sugar transferase [Anaerolineae bacterium]